MAIEFQFEELRKEVIQSLDKPTVTVAQVSTASRCH